MQDKKIAITYFIFAIVIFFIFVSVSIYILAEKSISLVEFLNFSFGQLVSLFLITILNTFIIYLYLSTFIYTISIIKGRDFKSQPLFGIKYLNEEFFGLGFFLSILFVLGKGLGHALFFIPDGWGSLDQEGDWVSIKEYLSFFISFFVSGWLLIKIREDKNRDNN